MTLNNDKDFLLSLIALPPRPQSKQSLNFAPLPGEVAFSIRTKRS